MPGGLGAWGLGPGRWGAGGPFRGNGSGNREIWWTGTRVHFFFVPFPPSPVRRTSPIGNSSLITAKKKKKISKIPSIPPLDLIGTPASLAKQSKQRFSNRRNSTPVHHPRPPELTSLNLCSRVDDACSGSAPSRRRRRAQVQCHRLTGAILPSSHPPILQTGDMRRRRQAVCLPNLPTSSAVCRLPSAPACPVTANQGRPFVMHAHSVPPPPTTPTTTSRTSCKQTRPMCGKDSDQTLERHVGTPNATLASMTSPGKVQTGYTHTPTTDSSDHPSSIQYSGSAL